MSPTEPMNPIDAADASLAEIAALRERAEKAESKLVLVESSGHYCDGMAAAWTDAQIAITETTTWHTLAQELGEALEGLKPYGAKSPIKADAALARLQEATKNLQNSAEIVP